MIVTRTAAPLRVQMILWDGSPDALASIQTWTAPGDDDTFGAQGFYPRDQLSGVNEHARLWDARKCTWDAVPLGYYVVKDQDKGFYALSPQGAAARFPRRCTPPSQEPSDDLTAYINDLMDASSIPESWDDDASANDILKRYFLELERRVVALGGSLEAWPEEDDDGNATRCPTCTSREPRLHPAAGDGGEVTALCPDAFHVPSTMPTVYGIRGHRVMTAEEAAEAQRAYEAAPLAGIAQVRELIGPAWTHQDARCSDDCYKPKEA